MKRAALVAALALVALVWRFDGTARGPRWSQAEAERRIRETARTLGVDAQAWRVTATSVLDEEKMRLIEKETPRWPEVYAPLRYVVTAHAPADAAQMMAEYTPEGALLRWDCRDCQTGTGDAESAFRLVAGTHASEFKLRDLDESKSYWRWTWQGPSVTGTSVEARASLDHERLRNVVVEADLPPSVRRSLHAPGTTVAVVLHEMARWLTALGLSAAALLLLFRATRRRELRRVVIAMAALYGTLFFLTLAVEGWRLAEGDRVAQRQFGGRQPQPNWFVDNLLGRPLFWVLPCAAGLLLIRRREIDRWVGYLHLTARWRASRRTGEEMFDGLLLGWPLAAAPFAVGLVAGSVWNAASPRLPFEHVPALAALVRRDGALTDQLLFFGFVVPFLLAFLKRPRWRWLWLAVTGVSVFGGMARFTPTMPVVSVLAGLAFGAASVWVYTHRGLMGVVAATAGSEMALPLAWMATDPVGHAAPLVASAAIYGGCLAGAAWLRRQGVAGEDEELAAEIARRNDPEKGLDARSERELLQAEFAEARAAQQGMLPERAPEIPGFTLAAVCLPAREVGGDLYDFLEFPDGRWGLCVADVSGKGVPAALYMTMTKGLLASERRRDTDLDEMALALNEPLYTAGRHRTFVTLVLARLEPETGLVELIRAGHNPPLLRRASTNETVFEQPGGMGLGLVSNRLFSKTLQKWKIQMEEGDTLILYSDGLTEAMNPRMELFGEQRFMELAALGDGMNASELLQTILDRVEEFKEGADPHDDLTLMVLRRERAGLA